MIDMQALVSVIIPTYNREKVLPRALQSVLSQTYRNLEVLVVDDGSKDHTAEYMERIEDKRVRYIRLPENGGVSAARNVGVTESRGGYIAFQDSDDEWLPDKMKRQMKMFESCPNAGMVYCAFIKKTKEKELYYPWKDMPLEMKSDKAFSTLLYRPLVATPCMVVPKPVWNQTGGFRKELKVFEDWELTLRIAEKYPLAFVDEPLVHVYESEDSTVINSTEAIRGEFYMMKEYMEHYAASESRKEKLDGIAARVRTREDLEEYRKGMEEVMHFSF